MKKIKITRNNVTHELDVSENGTIFFNGKEVKQYLNKRTGYKQISLMFGEKQVSLYPHRIVAEAFHGRMMTEEKTFVDHIDSDRTNNRADNLRWVTRITNNSTPHSIYQRSINGQNIMKNHTNQIIKAIKDNETKYFRNGIEACRELGCSHPLVYMALMGKTPTCKGWTLSWVDKSEHTFEENENVDSNLKKIQEKILHHYRGDIESLLISFRNHAVNHGLNPDQAKRLSNRFLRDNIKGK